MKLPLIVAAGVATVLLPAFDAGAGPGNIFVANGQGGQVYEYTLNGNQTPFGTAGAPFGLALDSNNNLFVGDESTGSIFKFTPGGSRTTFASGLNTPLGLAFDNYGDLFVANAVYGSTGTIYLYTPSGSRIPFATGLGTPVGLAFSSGNLFVADAGAGVIYKFNSVGVKSTFASGLAPNSLAFDANGNLFETDHSGNIYKFDVNANRTTFASGLSAGSLTGLTFDASGNLFVADTSLNIIRKYAPDGSESTFVTGLNIPTGLVFEPGIASPILNIAYSGSNTVMVSWSSTSANFGLQTNSDLTTANWNPSNYSISITNGTNYSVTLPSTGGKSFFRLEQ